MATKNNPGRFDCYENAKPGEPMFVLLVWLWAVISELDQETPEKVEEARECSVALTEWLAAQNGSAVGVCQSVLAGVLELIRTADFAVPAAKNSAIDTDLARAFFAQIMFEGAGDVRKSDD